VHSWTVNYARTLRGLAGAANPDFRPDAICTDHTELARSVIRSLGGDRAWRNEDFIRLVGGTAYPYNTEGR
jgi:hypothetical protein